MTNLKEFLKVTSVDLVRKKGLEHSNKIVDYLELKLDNDTPFLKAYTTNTELGEWVEKLLDLSFDNYAPSKSLNYDGISKAENKIEVKAIRHLLDKGKAITSDLVHRSVTSSQKNHSGTWQQVKPAEFDILIGAAIFLDKIELYKVHSHSLTFDKSKEDLTVPLFPLSGQHKGNPTEGQLNLNKVRKVASCYLGVLVLEGEEIKFIDSKGYSVTTLPI